MEESKEDAETTSNATFQREEEFKNTSPAITDPLNVSSVKNDPLRMIKGN